MESNILNTVKLQLGLPEEYTFFDNQLLVCINTAVLNLEQIGALDNTISITAADTWDSIFGAVEHMETLIQNYVCMKSKMLFDPPTGGAKEAYDNAIKEIEWRITVYRDELEG